MEVNHFLLILLLVTATYTDIRKNRIPNSLTITAAGIGVLFFTIKNGWEGLLFSISGMVVGFMVMFLLYLFGAISAGDVKIFAAIGALTGTDFVLYSAMYTMFYAGIIGLIILILKKDWLKRIKRLYYLILHSFFLRQLKEIHRFKNRESIRFPLMYAVFPAVATVFYYLI